MTGNDNEMTRACPHGAGSFCKLEVLQRILVCAIAQGQGKETKKEDAAASKKQDPI
ncbi:hypothetical protein MITSMUL_04256 [Mitsuokella multacida DSM 20544]|uniref:Uncharacterized protein n=1 Tax=Mitsuokella multacida DSM 20544 TaxID=500635 RepID=C9KM21_9FIRM|nr:hypothetical protein MITSMUL_04256 [Mitsuokella multacida DSM 20544]